MALPSDSGAPIGAAPNYGGAQAPTAASPGSSSVASTAGLSASPSYGAVAVASSSAVASLNYGGAKSQVQAGLPVTISSTIFPSYVGGFAIGLSPIGVG